MRNLHLSLEQIEQDYWGEPEYNSYLVTRCYELRRVPIQDMEPGDLRILISQNIGLEYLLPLAVNLLEQDPLLDATFFPGDLLKAVLRAAPAFWQAETELCARLHSICRTLPLASLDKEIVETLNTFLKDQPVKKKRKPKGQRK